jgi:hypothetical protein
MNDLRTPLHFGRIAGDSGAAAENVLSFRSIFGGVWDRLPVIANSGDGVIMTDYNKPILI